MNRLTIRFIFIESSLKSDKLVLWTWEHMLEATWDITVYLQREYYTASAITKFLN